MKLCAWDWRACRDRKSSSKSAHNSQNVPLSSRRNRARMRDLMGHLQNQPKLTENEDTRLAYNKLMQGYKATHLSLDDQLAAPTTMPARPIERAFIL